MRDGQGITAQRAMPCPPCPKEEMSGIVRPMDGHLLAPFGGSCLELASRPIHPRI